MTDAESALGNPRLTPEILLRAYAAGIFPMAEDADSDDLFWIDPQQRGVIPLDRMHVPHRLRRTIRRRVFELRYDTAFADVIRACASPTADRPRTWINEEIVAVYTNLFESGFGHSVETWADGELVGGLYGIALGGAFFGESMFSRVADASKVALVHLAAVLITGGFTLLDTQFVTPHLSRFGAVEIPRGDYRRRLRKALQESARFQPGLVDDPLAVLQSSSQTS